MKRHYFISDDLDDLESVEEELEAKGLATPQIHVYTNDDAGVDQHEHLHNMEAVLKKDVVYGTEKGAIVGVIAAALVVGVAYFMGWPETVTWVPFIFLAIVLLGFCTWEGGFLGIQEIHHDFRRFKDDLAAGKHVFFVDIDDEQLPILEGVVSAHPRLQMAGTGSATPKAVVGVQKKWSDFMQSMP